ncbi:MAG TPA: hypothetical protein VFT38_13810, partial [Vicinamibacteria bacterium]|nr:hypothetical protein [Vicinamibacteria bacterium]
MEFLKNPSYDFLGKTKFLLAVSITLILVGVAYISSHGLRYGVEFSGGTQLIARFQSRPEVDKVRSAADTVMSGATIQTYDDPSKNQVLIRLPHTGGSEGDLSGSAQAVLQALKARYGENPVVESSTEIVGPVVGAELRRKAVQLTVWGLLFQLIYIAFRFGGAVWGLAATVAVFHDVLITLGLLDIFGFEITLNPGGAEKFKRETGRNIGRRLAIILDGSVASAPNINSQIGAEGVITGRFSVQEADELAKILRAGALPATLKYLQELTVG